MLFVQIDRRLVDGADEELQLLDLVGSMMAVIASNWKCVTFFKDESHIVDTNKSIPYNKTSRKQHIQSLRS